MAALARALAGRFSGASLKLKFMLFYVLLVLLPMLVFMQWYSAELSRAQRDQLRSEKRQILEQTLKILDGQLLSAESVKSTLQSNRSLIRLMQNQYKLASDEIYAYLTDVRPMLTSQLTFHAVMDQTFVYRYTDSAIRDAGQVYYIVNAKDFSYGEEILNNIPRTGFLWTAVMDPRGVRQRSNLDEAKLSPKLVCFSRLYDYTTATKVGILELQVNLNSLLSQAAFLASGETLTLECGGAYYPVEFQGSAKVRYEDRLTAAPAEGGSADLVSVDLERAGIRFIYRYTAGGAAGPAMVSGLLTALLLLTAPALLFVAYVYRFTGRLVRFSAHIQRTRGGAPTEYSGSIAGDEFGVVVAEYNRMTQTISSLIESVRRAEQKKNEASYYALQSQVNPHFLFNTLENIRIHAERRESAEVGDMLFALSRLMQYNISLRRESTVLSELEHIRHYLVIYRFRYQNRVTYTIGKSEEFEDAQCPFCILQPVVENCFKHGMKNGKDKISVAITLSRGDDGVAVEIRDDGAGMELNRLDALNRALAADECEPCRQYGNVGLRNVSARIRYFYGERFGVSFAPNSPSGLVCTLRLGLKARAESCTARTDREDADMDSPAQGEDMGA